MNNQQDEPGEVLSAEGGGLVFLDSGEFRVSAPTFSVTGTTSLLDQHIKAVARQAVEDVLRVYDKALPARVRQINEAPRRRDCAVRSDAAKPGGLSIMKIGTSFDEEGRPLFELTGPDAFPLEYLERVIAEYRRTHPTIR